MMENQALFPEDNRGAIENIAPPSEDAEKIEKNDVGLIGFLCPKNGKPYTFKQCFTECPDHCEPLPLLLALAKGRTVVPKSYGVTEILNPPQIVYYSRNFSYYSRPQDLIWMTFGTAWHTIMEREDIGAGKFIMEDPFEVDFGYAKLRGRPDLYDVEKKTLWDFKTLKYYFIKKIRDTQDWDSTTHHWQMNIYRVYKFPETKQMKIEALVKDHSRQIEQKHGIKPIEQLDVPFIDDGQVERTVQENLQELIKNQDDPTTIRRCRADELWVNREGLPLRCMEYCPISHLCKQGREYKDAQDKHPRKSKTI